MISDLNLSKTTESIKAKKLERKPTEEIIIGKDILELLSNAMYVEPLTIYREYLQNSADSFDEAVKCGLFENQEQGRVDIKIDPINRNVRIIDNGVGLSKKDFEKRMTAFGASKKRDTDARGFRGVGRLAGIAYCRELIFRTKLKEESEVLQLKWDCKVLKSILLDSNHKGSLSDVVKDVVSISSITGGNYPEHFFEVEMKSIVKHKKDNLLDPDTIDHYIAQVAPVPFSPHFSYSEKITSSLKDHIALSNMNVFIDDRESPVYRLHRDRFNVSDVVQDTFKGELDCFTISGVSGDVGAIGWILHHNYLGAISPKSGIKGFRIRSGNIQVGEDNLLDELFLETRFNSWTVGEIHVIDKNIKPNGRRDNFEQNIHFLNLLNQLSIKGREISKFCRNSSILRNKIKTFENEERKIFEKISFLKQQVLPEKNNSEIKSYVEDSLRIMGNMANSDLIEDEDKNRLLKRFSEVQNEIKKDYSLDNDPLSKLPKQKREIYQEVFGLVYDCSVNPMVAKSLIDRILSRLSSSTGRLV